MTREGESQVRQGAKALGLALEDVQVNALLDYLAMIQKWNKVYNLTAVRDPMDMLTLHLMDSLAIIAPLRRQIGASGPTSADAAPVRLLDVGAGAGLPGVVLAICCPGLRVDCVDAVAKKAAFIQQVALALSLPTLRGLHARVETLTGPYDIIASRAFASLADFVRGSAASLAPGGVWLAMKGKYPQAELEVLPTDVAMFHVEPLTVPGLAAERCLVWLRRQALPSTAGGLT